MVIFQVWKYLIHWDAIYNEKKPIGNLLPGGWKYECYLGVNEFSIRIEPRIPVFENVDVMMDLTNDKYKLHICSVHII